MKFEAEFVFYLAALIFGFGMFFGWCLRGAINEIVLSRKYHQGLAQGYTDAALYLDNQIEDAGFIRRIK
jgi:hypothetical protein